MEIIPEKSECLSFINCAFCFGTRNLKDVFEKDKSNSNYSSMIMNCFDIQVKRVSEDLKICEICIEQLSGTLMFKHKLDCFIVSKQSSSRKSQVPQIEIKHEKSECLSFVNCAFCFGTKNLKDMFEKDKSASKYSSTILDCFDIQIKRVSEELKICEICIEQLNGTLMFKHKLDCFIISKPSTENVYKDDCSSEFSNINLASVVKNECLIDDCYNLEPFVSELESESNFKSEKNTKSSISIDFQIEKSDFKTENPDEKPNGKALICRFCKEEFNTHTLLLQHYPNHNLNYICDVCGDAHVTKTSLIRHLSKHTLKQHPCKHCENSFASKNSLYEHMQLQHKGIRLYPCQSYPEQFSSYVVRKEHQTEYHGIPAKRNVSSSCGKSYSTSSALSFHKRRVRQKIKNFPCTVCHKTFFKKEDLDCHLIKHTSENNFECNMCNKTFSRKGDMDRHFVLHRAEKNFECTMCDKKFFKKRDLDRHFVLHTGEKSFECNVCNKKFARKCNLNDHFIIHTDEKNFECNVCNKKYFRKSDLNHHLVMHTDEKNFECNVCNKKFSRKYCLRLHFLTHTGQKNFECTLCNKKFTRKGSLNKHFVTHTGEKNFECTLCNKKFSRKGDLDMHFIVMHTDEKDFKCNMCSKKFFKKRDLDRHFVLHTGEKNFECNLCNKKFSRMSNLKNHFVMHTGEKSFECNVCDKKFARKCNLDRHLLLHTDEKSIECEVCGESFAKNRLLTMHMKIHTNT